jgi:hypothetical protein
MSGILSMRGTWRPASAKSGKVGKERVFEKELSFAPTLVFKRVGKRGRIR